MCHYLYLLQVAIHPGAKHGIANGLVTLLAQQCMGVGGIKEHS